MFFKYIFLLLTFFSCSLNVWANSFFIRFNPDCYNLQIILKDLKILKTYPEIKGLYLVQENSFLNKWIKNQSNPIKNKCFKYIEKNSEIRIDNPVLYESKNWNDPFFERQWYLSDDPNVARINAREGWSIIHESPEIVVSVVDSGIDTNHPDLSGNLWINSGEKGVDQNGRERESNGVDDDRNGYIDDFEGWDFLENTNRPMDLNGHGTHCAGLIGAVANNFNGIVGITHKVKLMPLRFLNKSGSGTVDGAVSAIIYAVKNGAKIINNSWGHSGDLQSLSDAINYARDNQVLMVAAAGNSNTNLSNSLAKFYPAGYPHTNIISVAAHNEDGNKATFSNYGTKEIDLAAPGTNMLSLLPNLNYGVKNGTSMATPVVSGALALMLSYFPEMNIDEIKERLLKSTVKELDLADKVLSRGRLDLYNALMGIFPQPDWEENDEQWPLVQYQLFTDHPTLGTFDKKWTIHVEKAKYLRILFDKIDMENIYDLIYLYDKNNNQVELIKGPVQKDHYFSKIIKGDILTIRFRSQYGVTRYGFDISKIGVIKSQ